MKLVVKTPSGEKAIPLKDVKSIEALSQCNLIVIKRNRETIQGISVKFEK